MTHHARRLTVAAQLRGPACQAGVRAQRLRCCLGPGDRRPQVGHRFRGTRRRRSSWSPAKSPAWREDCAFTDGAWRSRVQMCRVCIAHGMQGMRWQQDLSGMSLATSPPTLHSCTVAASAENSFCISRGESMHEFSTATTGAVCTDGRGREPCCSSQQSAQSPFGVGENDALS